MADLIWGGGDSFQMNYDLTGTGANEWSGLTEPPDPEDHAISGQENGDINYVINSGSGSSGQNSGTWRVASGDFVFNDSSDWQPPIGLNWLLPVTDSSADIDFFAEITTVGSGTGTSGELIAPSSITSARDVLAGTETLTFGPDARLASDTQFRVVIILNQFIYTKETYTSDNITPETSRDTFDYTGAVDGDNISTPDLKALGQTTYTVSNGGSEGATTTLSAQASAVGSKIATSNTHTAGLDPHLVSGNGTITHRNITFAMSSVSISVSVS